MPPSCCLCSNPPPTSLGNCVAIGRFQLYSVSHTISVLGAHKKETIDVSKPRQTNEDSVKINVIVDFLYTFDIVQSQWPRGLRRGSATALNLVFRAWIRPEQFVSRKCSVFIQNALRWADHSSRGVLFSVVRLSMIVNHRQWESLCSLGAVVLWKKITIISNVFFSEGEDNVADS
jgi:hypothetical protein